MVAAEQQSADGAKLERLKLDDQDLEERLNEEDSAEAKLVQEERIAIWRQIASQNASLPGAELVDDVVERSLAEGKSLSEAIQAGSDFVSSGSYVADFRSRERPQEEHSSVQTEP